MPRPPNEKSWLHLMVHTTYRKVQLFIAVDKFMCMLYFYQNIKHNIVSENRTSCKDLTTGCGDLGLTLIQNALFELPLCCKEVLSIAWPLVVTDVSDQSIQSGFKIVFPASCQRSIQYENYSR